MLADELPEKTITFAPINTNLHDEIEHQTA